MNFVQTIAVKGRLLQPAGIHSETSLSLIVWLGRFGLRQKNVLWISKGHFFVVFRIAGGLSFLFNVWQFQAEFLFLVHHFKHEPQQ